MLPEEIGFRYVRCYCGNSEVVTRRTFEFDRYAVCSFDCYTSMVNDGKQEVGSLFMEVARA